MNMHEPTNQQSFPDVSPGVNAGDLTSVKGDKMIISHDYNDLAWVTENEAMKMFPQQGRGQKRGDPDVGEEDGKKKRKTRKAHSRGGVAEPFPLKLHRMLDTVEAQGLSHIVSWQPHGRAFLVHNPKAFVSAVLPQFSKQKKINSFHRQLQLYGFMRITRGPDSGAYYHERFLIGRPYLCRSLCRTKVKGLFQKPIIDPNTEPNFYSMTHLERPSGTSKLSSSEISPDDSCMSSLLGSDSVSKNPAGKPQVCISESAESSKPLVSPTPSAKRNTKLLEMATHHLRNMGPSKQLSSLRDNFNRIEPVTWQSSLSGDGAQCPTRTQGGSDGNDFCEFLSTASILQRFLTDK